MHTKRRFMTIVAITIVIVWFYVHFVKVSKYGFYLNHSSKVMTKKMDFRAGMASHDIQRDVKLLMKESEKEEESKEVSHTVKLENISLHPQVLQEIYKHLQNIGNKNGSRHHYFVDQKHISKSFQNAKGSPRQDLFSVGTKKNFSKLSPKTAFETDLRQRLLDTFKYSLEKSPLTSLLIKDLLQRPDIIENLQYISKILYKRAPRTDDVEPKDNTEDRRISLVGGKTIEKLNKFVPKQETEDHQGNLQENLAYHHQGFAHVINDTNQERFVVKQSNASLHRTDMKRESAQLMEFTKQQLLDHIAVPKLVVPKIRDLSCTNCFVHNFKYIINYVDICQTASPMDSVYLFIMIFTVHENFKQREAIRKTWLTYARQNRGHIRYAFLLGKPENDTLHEKVLQENFLHNDILKEDFVDSYMNLTYKTIMGFKWVVTFCQTAQYVLKTDDDMYVNIPNIISFLQQFGGELDNVIAGNCYNDAKPERDNSSKWYVSKDFYKEENYPDFCTGTGYLTSINIVEKIYRVSQHVSFFHLEDVYVGFCLRQIGGTVKPVKGFYNYRPELNACLYKGDVLFTSHWMSPENMEMIWKSKCYNIT